MQDYKHSWGCVSSSSDGNTDETPQRRNRRGRGDLLLLSSCSPLPRTICLAEAVFSDVLEGQKGHLGRLGCFWAGRMLYSFHLGQIHLSCLHSATGINTARGKCIGQMPADSFWRLRAWCLPALAVYLQSHSCSQHFGEKLVSRTTGVQVFFFLKPYLLLFKPVSRMCTCTHAQALCNQLHNGQSLLSKSHWLTHYLGPSLQDFTGRGQQQGTELAVCHFLKPLQVPEHSGVSGLQASHEQTPNASGVQAAIL